MSSLVITNIGELLTCDPAAGDGPLGIRRGVDLVIDQGTVAQIIATGGSPSADRRIDAAGACVMPGFVDSHTHTVFAGDRGAEFAARMAGAAYQAGGIRTTVAATRAASDQVLDANLRALLAESAASGVTHSEIKSGYGLSTEQELRCLNVAAAHSSDLTFLGAHVVPAEYENRADDYVALVCQEMIPAVAPVARWVDVFCEEGAFDADQSRAILRAGIAAGLGARIHANQLSAGPGVQLAVELGAASADHCTFLSPADREALSGSWQGKDPARGEFGTVATFLPATDFSTRMPYPDARAAIDAGCVSALASNCNPGSSFTTSMGFVLALAVRDLRMTAEEAILAATWHGALALRLNDRGRLSPGYRGDVQILRAPSYTHWVYRPGVPLVQATLRAGEPIFGA